MAVNELIERILSAVGEGRRESGLVMDAVYQPVRGGR
jgi:hypothetical protein